MDKIKEVVKKAVPDEEIKIKKSFRLGKVNAGSRPRLIKFSVENEDIKERILKNAYKANSRTEKDPSKRIFINLDLTRKQREADKIQREKLKQDLKERKENGEKDIYIRGGKIVKVRPQ